MNRYETYKPSGIDWIGEVPEVWEIKRIKRIAEILRGASPRPIDDEKYFDDNGEFSWVRISDVTASETYLNETYEKLSELGSSLSVKIKPGDLFVSIAGSVGKPIISNIKACIHDGFVWLKSPKVDTKYLYYILNADGIYGGLGKLGTQLNLNTQILGSVIIPIPSKTEQLTIANYLDDQTQKIDRLIANKKTQAEKLKELRQIEINNAVTKGLNPNAEMKDSGIEWLGKIPKHWEVKKIKQLLKPEKNAIKTGPFGSDLKFEDLIEEGIKVYNQRSVLDNDWKSGEGYISAEKYESLRTCTIFPDDIVITTRGTIGKVSIFPSDAELGILHPCLMRIQMNSQRILNDYLKIIINDSSFFFEALKLASNATTIDVIYSDSLKEVKIPVPPTNEQIEITTYLQKRVSAIDQLIKNIEAQIEKLQEVRKIKIYEAVTGKIKVNAYAETTALPYEQIRYI